MEDKRYYWLKELLKRIFDGSFFDLFCLKNIFYNNICNILKQIYYKYVKI